MNNWDYDGDKTDGMPLAPLCLVIHGKEGEERAGKGFDRETMNRLHGEALLKLRNSPWTKAKGSTPSLMRQA